MEATEYSEKTKQRLLWIVIAVVIISALSWWGWRRHRRNMSRRRTTTAQTAPTLSPSSTLAQPLVPVPRGLALELWIKNPEAIAAKVIPRLIPQNAPAALIPTFATILKNGMPPESQGDIDALDLTKPIGYAVLEPDPEVPPPPDGGWRFVIAATVKNADLAKKVIEGYATREGAVKERSEKLQADTFKGAKTGRYLVALGDQVLFGSDRPALEEGAPRLAAGLSLALIQSHDVVARAPQSFIAGPFAQSIKSWWIGWSAPQLNGATSGPAKALFDQVATAASTTWPGAEDLELIVDVDDHAASATATLRAKEGTPLSKFLSEYPQQVTTILADAPRDALGVMALQFPQPWLEVARKFLVTPPPEAADQIPIDMKEKTEKVFGQLAEVLEGEILVASVADPPPNGGPGASLMRFKVKDPGRGKQAAHDFVEFFLGGSGMPVAPITSEGGGIGESLEIIPPPQPPQPPMPPIGMAWVLRGDYVYVARGASPKARAIAFASLKPEDHLASDPVVTTRLGTLPTRSALAAFIAPLRADTPLALGMGVAPLSDAITLSLLPSPNGVVLHGDFDLGLTVQVLAPMLMQGPQAQPGMAPGGPAMGAVPPGSPGGVPNGVPGGAPGTVPKPPGGGGQPKPPGGGGQPKPPQIVVPPAPTGYVLPIPKPGSGANP